MKIYTGIDIVDNRRIKRAIDKSGKKFLSKVFTEREISYCSSKKNLHGCFAARFAVKEAFIKASFQAFGQAPYLNEIEILGKEGKPAEILLHSPKIQEIHSKTPFNITFSLSHEREFSVAVVIIYLP